MSQLGDRDDRVGNGRDGTLHSLQDDLRAALPGWVLGRVLTGIGWLLAVLIVRARSSGVWTVQMHQGLFAWDAAFYRDIARLGYAGVGPASTRFHPLLPLVGRTDLGLLVVANGVALLAAAAVHRLVSEVMRDADLARRAATLVGVAPPAFVLVWAYAEGLFVLLSALLLLALHRRWWWWTAAFGALATLARPTGVLLIIPVLVVVLTDAISVRDAPAAPPPQRTRLLAQGAAVLAPGAVMAGWLWWVGRTFDDAWLPLRVQSELRGAVRLPPLRLIEGVGEVVRDPLGDGLHLPFAVVIVWLAWIAWRRLPRAWGAYAVVTAVVMLSAENLNSIERYALGNVALLVAGAAVARGRLWRPTVAASGSLLIGMSALAWYGRYVP